MQNKLVLKDGTEIINGSASKSSNNRLMIHVPGNDIVNATLMFGDPNKTEEIVCYFGIHRSTYTGYTELYTVQYFQEENFVEIWLKGDITSFYDEIIVPEEYVPEEKPYTENDVEEETEDA